MLADAANQMLLTFKQLMMLDDKLVAKLWGRSTPDEVANELRKYAAEREELAKMAEKKSAAEEQQLMGQAQQDEALQQQNNDEMQAREDIKHLTEIKSKQNNEIIKGVSKIAPNNKKAQDMLLKAGQNLQQ